LMAINFIQIYGLLYN
jgi:hypothetical protein